MELVIGALVIVALGYLFFYRDSKIWGTNKSASQEKPAITEAEAVKPADPVIEVQAVKVEVPAAQPTEPAVEEKPKRKARKPKAEKPVEAKAKSTKKPKMSVAK